MDFPHPKPLPMKDPETSSISEVPSDISAILLLLSVCGYICIHFTSMFVHCTPCWSTLHVCTQHSGIYALMPLPS